MLTSVPFCCGTMEAPIGCVTNGCGELSPGSGRFLYAGNGTAYSALVIRILRRFQLLIPPTELTEALEQLLERVAVGSSTPPRYSFSALMVIESTTLYDRLENLRKFQLLSAQLAASTIATPLSMVGAALPSPGRGQPGSQIRYKKHPNGNLDNPVLCRACSSQSGCSFARCHFRHPNSTLGGTE
jgi:hypothetical protein